MHYGGCSWGLVLSVPYVYGGGTWPESVVGKSSGE